MRPGWVGIALLLPQAVTAASFPAEQARGGMVVADSAVASRVGADILAAGGDAVDAAAATALALGVVHPFASGIGGGGFAVLWRADERRAYTLDFREVAPRRATASMYLDAASDIVPQASTRGPRAAGVPGELAGLWALHQRHGKLPWARIVAPALRLARDGFPAGALLADRVARHQAELAARPALAALFLRPSGAPIEAGERIRRPALARTLARIAEQGAGVFYTGAVAQRMARAIERDGGLIDAADLAAYRPRARAPIDASLDLRDPRKPGRRHAYRLIAMPPPSSGGLAIVQVLRSLEGLNLPALGHNSSAYLHRLTEALKHAFADRAAIMGDPDFTEVPQQALIGDAAVARVRAAFQPHTTLPRAAYGGDWGLPEDAGTTHFNVVDAQGNAVALTSTINTAFGSLYLAGDTGVLLNNEMDDFVAKPGVPNAYGLIGQAANAIAPGKRPLSSMSPTLVLEHDRVILAVGGSGGPTIITGTLQVLINVLAFGMDPRAAVEAPRVHHQWVPDVLFAEPELAADVLEALRLRGHQVKVRPRFNAVQALQASPGWQRGASDPSKLGAPAGVP